MTPDIRIGRIERGGEESTTVEIIDRQEGYPSDHEKIDIVYPEPQPEKTAKS